ncbi:unnamed protein product [Protopolystoma xenopodis]|uniref:Uncharacterized protein n=1 Tax=Protopolystoma xenopodis TaxID=117903 RepID=A0A448X8X7_9PLAT|nr:unnamed protein product [Protopolystoma xenopodis]
MNADQASSPSSSVPPSAASQSSLMVEADLKVKSRYHLLSPEKREELEAIEARQILEQMRQDRFALYEDRKRALASIEEDRNKKK